jgi:hypothetical protein
MILSTCHGTYAVAGQDGQLMHLSDRMAEDFHSVLSGAPLPTPASGLREVEIIQGPLAPSTMVVLEDGLVAFHRNHVYLCAVPGRPELYFEAKLVGPWERFTITERDGTVVPQNVEAKPTLNAAWFEKHGIDVSIASKPSLGQTFSISGTVPQEQISYIYLEPAGRFGNNVFQLINAYWLAKSLVLGSRLFRLRNLKKIKNWD